MTAPVLSYGELINLLAGEAYERPATEPCRHCRGTGKVVIGSGRGEKYDCPMCRGKGVVKPKH